MEGLKPGIVTPLDKPTVATIVPSLYTLYPTVSPPDANSGHVILAVVLVTVLAEITGGINQLGPTTGVTPIPRYILATAAPILLSRSKLLSFC